MDDTLKLVLRTPIAFGGETISEISLREPKVGELERAQKFKPGSQIGFMISLMTLVSGVADAAIREMAMSDFMKGSNFLESFSSGGRQTGEAASPTSPASSDGARETLAN